MLSRNRWTFIASRASLVASLFIHVSLERTLKSMIGSTGIVFKFIMIGTFGQINYWVLCAEGNHWLSVSVVIVLLLTMSVIQFEQKCNCWNHLEKILILCMTQPLISTMADEIFISHIFKLQNKINILKLLTIPRNQDFCF